MATLHLVYFSPAFSTRKVIRMIGESIDMPAVEHDITQGITEPLIFNPDDLVVFGAPVFSGRIPAMAVKALEEVKGTNTSAMIVAVYGNRDYDDALLELQHIVEAGHFHIIGAAAFIARHSIFPQVAAGRPDEQDQTKIADFAKQCMQKYLSRGELSSKPIKVKGNTPYKIPNKIPLIPNGDKKCNECGTCVSMCPTHAIPKEKPRKTNKDLCISCTRCIAVCPQKARHFYGLMFRFAAKKFIANYSNRKEPEIFV